MKTQTSITSVSSTVYYWETYIDPKKLFATEHKERIDKVVTQLLYGNTSSADMDLKQRTASGVRIYGARLSKSDRLLFTTVSIAGQMQLLLLDVVENHDYQKSWVFKPQALNAFMHQDFTTTATTVETKENEGFTSCDNPITSQSTVKEYQLKGAKHYQNQFIELNDIQHAAVASTLPMLIRGPAGSGKSCVAYALLEQQLKMLADSVQFEPQQKMHFLFIAKSSRLVEHFKQSFNDALEICPSERFMLDFKSYEQLALENDPELAAKEVVDISHFQSWLNSAEKRFKAYKKTLGFTEDSLYKEFKIIAALQGNQEVAYQKLGIQETRISQDERAMVYELFEAYQKHLGDQFVDLSLYPLKSQAQYDLIVVDESQDFSRTQLISLRHLTRFDQICFAMDTNQALEDALSDIHFLKTSFNQTPIKEYSLGESYRATPQIAEFANAVLKLKHIIYGGVSSRGEYGQFTSVNSSEVQGGVCWLKETESQHVAFLKDSVKTAVITPAFLKKEAQNKFQTPLVFSVEEIKGLEYDNIILYKPFADSAFTLLNKLCPTESLQALTTKKNLPKQKELTEAKESALTHLNQLFVAVTRARHQLFIVQDETHMNKQLVNLLKESITPAVINQTAEDETTTASSNQKDKGETWLQEAHRLHSYGKKEQAAEILKKLNLADNYFEAQKTKKMPEMSDAHQTDTTTSSSKPPAIQKKSKKALRQPQQQKKPNSLFKAANNSHAGNSSIKINRQKPKENIQKIKTELLKMVSDDFCKKYIRNFADKHKYGINQYISISREQEIRYFTLLHVALSFKEVEAAYYLLKNGSDINLPLRGSEDASPLQLATQVGDLPLLKFMLEKGASLKHKDSNDCSVLQYAVANGHQDIVKYLLTEKKIDINQLDNRGANVLMLALSEEKYAIAEYLIKAGIDVNTMVYRLDYSPLIICSATNQIDIAKLLLKHGAIINKADNESQAAAIHFAANHGHVEMVDLLLANGADVNHIKCDQVSPLMLAAKSGYLGVVQKLIKFNAAVNIQNSTGHSALMLSIYSLDIAVIKELVMHGANLSIKNQDGQTALDIAKALALQAIKANQARNAYFNTQGRDEKSENLFKIIQYLKKPNQNIVPSSNSSSFFQDPQNPSPNQETSSTLPHKHTG